MENPSWFVPDYPPLGDDDVGRAAVEGQIVSYPAVVRSSVDPVSPGAASCAISYMLLDTPRVYKGFPIYGYVKVRGVAESKETMKVRAKKIVKEVDSKFLIRIGDTGTWLPITEYTTG